MVYEWSWSKCHSDEEGRAMGLRNRDEASDKWCKDNGYLGSIGGPGNYQDCGDWRFQIRCVKPGFHGDWKDDGCTEPGVRRFSRQVDAGGMDWDLAADWLLQRLGDTLNGKPIVRKDKNKVTAGMYIWVYVADDSCGFHGDWKDDGCTEHGLRRFSRQVDAGGLDWDVAADKLLPRLGDTFQGKPIVRKEKSKVLTGMYIWVFVRDNSCNPNWGEVTTICDSKGKEMRYSHCTSWLNNSDTSCRDATNKPSNVTGWIKCDLGRDPKSIFCNPLTTDYSCALGKECYAVLSYGEGMDCDNERKEDAVNRKGKNFDVGTTTPCFVEEGKFGNYHDYVNQPITTDTEFTLEALNWISGTAGRKTFIKARPGALSTDDNVAITKEDLTPEYRFKFVKNDCQTDQYILYGNRVQLQSVRTGEYVQCGGGTSDINGTCSTVRDHGSCKKDNWQTFYVESKTGKTGRVCFGDQVYIRQTTGRQEAITAAGGGGVWSLIPGKEKNGNDVLVIQGKNGSIYKDPSKEMAAYETKRGSDLCEKDPANIQCTLGQFSAIGQFFSQYKLYFYITLLVIILCSCCSSAWKLSSYF